jgi:hypothetical protein
MGIPATLVVSLNDEAVAKLVAIDDVVSMEVRELDLPRPTTVTVDVGGWPRSGGPQNHLRQQSFESAG